MYDRMESQKQALKSKEQFKMKMKYTRGNHLDFIKWI